MRHGAMRRSDWAWIAGLALVFAPALLSMARVWLALDYYSHGFLVPIVAWWIALPRLRRLGPPGRHAGGSFAIATALALYAAGLAFDSVALQGFAFVGAIAGIAARLWGSGGLRALALPVALLLFMVPLPQTLLGPFILKLQLWVSGVGVEILHRAGFSVLREGNVVLLPGGESLFVDEACSGITSIVTLLPLGVVLGWLSLRTTSARVLLLIGVVPLAMLGNLVRVLATVVAARSYGVERVTSGALHDAAGLATFVLSCLLLIGLGRVLRRLLPGPPLARPAT